MTICCLVFSLGWPAFIKNGRANLDAMDGVVLPVTWVLPVIGYRSPLFAAKERHEA